MPEFGLSYDGVQVADVDEDGGLVLVEIEAAYRCVRCGETFEEESEAEDETCEDEDAECSVPYQGHDCEADSIECEPQHKLKAEPLSWANSAHISIDTEEDSIKVGISVGDPRGSFQMEIRRSSEDGRIYMHVPYVGMAGAHAPLKLLHEGTYAVNESE